MYFVYLFLILLSSCVNIDTKQDVSYINDTPLTPYNYRKTEFLSQYKLIPYNSHYGIKTFIEARYKGDFFALSQKYASQQYPTTCGVSSLRMVLAALYERMQKTPPLDVQHSLTAKKNGVNVLFFSFTEANIFDYIKSDVDQEKYGVISRQTPNNDEQYNGGIGGEHLVNIANSHPGINAQYFVAKRSVSHITQGAFKKLVDKNINCTKDCDVLKNIKNNKAISNGIKKFRKVVISTLKDDSKFMIAYFSHVKTLFGTFNGHFSPIAAFNDQKDMVLIMDVAGHLGLWYWIKIEDLYKSMSFDFGGGDRGYIIVGLTKKQSVL